ncbi:MAG: response regulator, partial [Chitinophagaceae bacterium]
MYLRPSIFSLILFMAGFVCCVPVVAQQADYQTISTAEGLSQGHVFDILQDAEGFIWVATKNGLNRYDGYSFKVYVNDPYNPNTISSNTITKLFEDSKGRIWAGTEDAGLNIFDKKTGKFYRLANKVSDVSSLSGNSIGAIEELADGRMLVGANGFGLNIIQLPSDFFVNGTIPIITRLSLPNKAYTVSFGKDGANTMWVGADDGTVYSFQPSTNSFIKRAGAVFLDNGYWLNDSTIIRGDRDRFLYNGKDAIPLFDTKKNPPGNLVHGWAYKPLNESTSKRNLKMNFQAAYWDSGKSLSWGIPMKETSLGLSPFIIDRSGIVWTGTRGYGLRKYNVAAKRFRQDAIGLSVRWIVPAKNEQLYLGNFITHWHALNKPSDENNAFLKITNNLRVDNLLITKGGDYWIQSSVAGYHQYNPSNKKLIAWPSINFGEAVGDQQPMLEDSKGYIWLPGMSGIITRLHLVSGRIEQFTINTNASKPMLPRAGITSVFEDAQGVFWVGTQDGFVKITFNYTNHSSPQLQWFYNNSNDRNSLNYRHVSSFIDDPTEPAKYLWISTKGGGLNRFDKTTGRFFHLTKKDGLPDDVVYGILADDTGNIWGSTNKGIFCLASPKKNNGKWIFRNFTKSEGLQGDEFNTGAYAKLSNGDLAFGGVNGLNIFNPKEVLAKNFEPNVFITDILVNNQPIAPDDISGVLQNTIEQSKSITLSHSQDILTLEFSSLDFTAPQQNKYRYQLVGVDDNWVESGTRRTATYLHLPSGDYVFKVQGSNSQGIWSNKISEIKIIVLPPWWKTWWAYTFYILLIVIAVSLYVRFYINRARLKAQLNFEQLEAKRMKELDTLKTQLYTNITHEFRTPLTVILGIAQQLVNKPSENFSNGMEMIIRNGKSLLKLVNEMLDLSKLETGNMQLQLTHGDVVNFLRYVTESFQSLAEGQQKGLHFLTGINALHVAYDAEKLRQIIVNLLSNALKFTTEKANVYITVSQNAIAGDDAQVALLIEVKDTGIGIPESKLPNIFDRFYQIDNSHTRSAEGTGIGLSLTKELVKLMGGEISVQSPPSGAAKGTAFTVVLPLQKVVPVEELVQYPIKSDALPDVQQDIKTINLSIKEEGNKDKPLLLLVEDNADVVAYTASCLPNYRLAVGKDGREGFEIAKEIIPDLIITDVMMPFVDGFEMVKRLRRDELTSHIPIIMLTAKAGMESKLEGLQRGADAYLEKPFHKEELLLRIKKLLELRQNLQQYYLRKAGMGNAEAAPDAHNEEKIIVSEAEDEFVKKVREAIVDNLANGDFTVEQLCKVVFMSHSQLHRKLDALTGFSPNKFIRIIRLNRAKDLLKNGSYNISSIAYDCGFNDPAYFTRVFK